MPSSSSAFGAQPPLSSAKMLETMQKLEARKPTIIVVTIWANSPMVKIEGDAETIMLVNVPDWRTLVALARKETGDVSIGPSPPSLGGVPVFMLDDLDDHNAAGIRQRIRNAMAQAAAAGRVRKETS